MYSYKLIQTETVESILSILIKNSLLSKEF